MRTYGELNAELADQLKAIAKATGVTQKSLLDAAKAGSSAKTTSSSKTGSSAKTGASSKTGSGAKTGASSKTGNSAKTASSSSSTLKLSAEEKRVLKAYREAEEGVQSIVRALLGADAQSSSASKKNSSLLESLLGGLAQNNSAPASTDGGSGNLLDVFMGMLGGK